MKPLTIQSNNGYNTYAIKGADYINAYYGDSVATTFTVPASAKFVLFSATDNFYVNWSGTAAIPSGDITNGSGSELNPIIRSITPGATFSVIAAADIVVTLSFYN